MKNGRYLPRWHKRHTRRWMRRKLNAVSTPEYRRLEKLLKGIVYLSYW